MHNFINHYLRDISICSTSLILHVRMGWNVSKLPDQRNIVYNRYTKALMKSLWVAIKNCICSCFHNEQDEYKERMIQLEQRMLNRQSASSKPDEHSDVFNVRTSAPDFITNLSSPRKQQNPHSMENHTPQPQQRHSNTSHDSYFTINSGSGSSYSISKRTFKSVKSRKSVSNPNVATTNNRELQQFKDLFVDYTSESDLKLSQVESPYATISESMFEWNEIEYERTSVSKDVPINATEQLKLSSNIFINEAVNKLEDYYTFYFNEINKAFLKSDKKEQQEFSPYSGHFFRKYPEFKCSYSCQHDNLNASSTYFSLMTFQSNTSNAIEFLKWYNSAAIRTKLFNFQKQKIIENGTFPVFEIQQFGSEIKEKHTYITVRQIETVKFDNEPDLEYILQLDTTFRKGNYFKSLIRFSDCENGLVEIYCECSQKLRVSPEAYYQKKWKTLEALIKDRLVKISVSRVVK